MTSLHLLLVLVLIMCTYVCKGSDLEKENPTIIRVCRQHHPLDLAHIITVSTNTQTQTFSYQHTHMQTWQNTRLREESNERPSVRCSVLQCVAVWCSVVQCGAVWCSLHAASIKMTIQAPYRQCYCLLKSSAAETVSTNTGPSIMPSYSLHTAIHCNKLQQAVTSCNILQRTATRIMPSYLSTRTVYSPWPGTMGMFQYWNILKHVPKCFHDLLKVLGLFCKRALYKWKYGRMCGASVFLHLHNSHNHNQHNPRPHPTSDRRTSRMWKKGTHPGREDAPDVLKELQSLKRACWQSRLWDDYDEQTPLKHRFLLQKSPIKQTIFCKSDLYF